MLTRYSENVTAGEQLLGMQAVAHGAAVALGGKDNAAANQMTRRLADLAYPKGRDG